MNSSSIFVEEATRWWWEVDKILGCADTDGKFELSKVWSEEHQIDARAFLELLHLAKSRLGEFCTVLSNGKSRSLSSMKGFQSVGVQTSKVGGADYHVMFARLDFVSLLSKLEMI